jgi:plastocyanin
MGMRKLIIVIAVVSLLGALTVLGAGVATGSGLSAAGTKSVTIEDNSFTPHKFSVAKGTVVRWTWASDAVNDHTVTQADRHFEPKDRGFGSEEQSSGTYKHRFRRTGTFYVICQVHPTEMRMKIRVHD